MNREAIHLALFAKLSAIPGLVKSSRKLLHWADVPAIEQPALFLAQPNETADNPAHGAPTRWTISFDVYVYVNTSADPSGAPATVLNPILDAIEVALAPTSPNGLQSLGGVVEHCRIAGQIQTFQGTLGDQEVAIIPIEIVTAP